MAELPRALSSAQCFNIILSVLLSSSGEITPSARAWPTAAKTSDGGAIRIRVGEARHWRK
jgi:hypothetical protein